MATVQKKHSLVEDVYARLKRDILSNHLPPGTQVPEPELSDRMGASRTPVREALIRLESEGLLKLIPRHGARILPISPSDMADIYQILIALEPEAAAALAATRPTAPTLAPLETATTEMEQALDARDKGAWAEADDRFHRALLAAAPNRRMANVIGTMLDQAHRARIVTLRMRAFPEASTREHRAILDAMADGDADTTRTLFRAHRQRAADELLPVLEELQLKQL